MSSNKFKYNLVNIVIILLTIGLFCFEYRNAHRLFEAFSLSAWVALVATVALVHIIKAARLYLALYGADIKQKDFIKTYCKVTPVSMILPFKLGEFFRMYCYGKLSGQLLKGIVIILFDRFMDTAALVTVIVFVWAFNGGRLELMVYLLLLFLLAITVIYYAFPGLQKFWTRYLLKSKASERKLRLLKTLRKANAIHDEVENAAKGKGIIMYLMSILAWGIEIGSLYVLGKISGESEITQKFFAYLKSAMGNNQSLELKRFIVLTVVFLIAVYGLLKIAETICGKKDR